MAQPRFSSECTEAFNSMNTQESPNDYFICGFDEGSNNLMNLVEAGRGGMARVKEVLREQFADKTAVALFRVTAVDDRENTVSYRTKLIHVIYTGPQTPVMKRAKITSFNAAFKQPFSFNLSIQTDDEEGDLNEASIERSLRASGGAHQPTRFDFINSSAPGGGESKVNRMASRSPSHASSAPSPKASPPTPVAETAEAFASAEDVFRHHSDAFDAQDVDAIVSDYAEDAVLFHTDATNKRTSIYNGPSEVAGFYRLFLDSSVEGLQVTGSSTVGNVSTVEYVSSTVAYGYDVFHVLNGKIKLQTIVTIAADASPASEPQAEEPEAVNEMYERTDAEAEEAVGEAVDQAVDGVDEAAAEQAAEEAPEEEEAAEEAPADEEAPAEEDAFAEEEAPADEAGEEFVAEEQ